MKKIRLDDLSEAAQKVLAGVGEEEVLVIEDENGQIRYGVIAYRKPTDQQRRRAWERLREFQKRADASMKKHGKTEDDVMRVVLEDD